MRGPRGPGGIGSILLAALAGVVLVIATLAYAATLPYAPFIPPPTDARGPQPNLHPFYQQTLAWTHCGRHGVSTSVASRPGLAAAVSGMQCARLTVPQDYAAPAKGTVSLAVTRFRAHASGHRLGSLVFNFGGPGTSGVDQLAARIGSFARLRDSYDLIGLDPRGWGRSHPLTCTGPQGEPPAAASADAAALLRSRDPVDDAGVQLRAEAEQYAQHARACAEISGPILPYVGTTSVSRDLDVLRQALGDRKLNYFGMSYGSKLGAVYAHQFPHTTGRMVLDGIVDPSLDTRLTALARAKDDQRGIRNFLADCLREHPAECPFHGKVDTAEARLQRSYDALDRHPLAVPGAELDQQTFSHAIADSVFDQHAWPALRSALRALLVQQEPVPLIRLGVTAVAGGIARPSGPSRVDPPADNAYAVSLAVECRDTADRYTPQEAQTALSSLVRASPILGALSLHEMLACTGWTGGGDNSWREVRAEGAPRILMVTTATDPVTPYRGARRMAAATGVGVVLTYRGQGHVAYRLSECVRQRTDRFFRTGLMPADGGTCD
ncbi:alpha/beta hydrolase [Streptantibioticus ferralitis]|uniref:Alpha/beta hydrolase n=1 Tax=Streptantibioticus ferralitis TaxID=236510 RepID=A0ABT5YT93_9ACTN|nr:alpha/beta hydrolase [Streptantibioticus ferralitis]MDF2254832.1 alpha/beta hydrolase [Streptantibioticus ferralitis]